MDIHTMTRRDWLKGTAVAATHLAAAGPISALRSQQEQVKASEPADNNGERRMKWWHEAKFGMFIHWGLYSILGRYEWVLENEGIPMSEYEPLAMRFKPQPNAARAWAKLARQTGQKYMVMTTKHHDGFCLFNTSATNYCAAKQGAGRDLVREYVEAARAEGMRVGFYYSLMDWHHPDGARCAQDEAARKRFVEYVHGQIHELLTNYGTIDILWYDVAWPLDAKGWESERMNRLAYDLQPDIILNDRNKLRGDFATAEPMQVAAVVKENRAWEACTSLNDSWGYQPADDNWKSPKQIVRNLISGVRDGGNFLLNIGPKPDGSIPEQSTQILSAVGRWMARNAEAIYASDPCQVRRSNYANFTRKGSTLFMHVHFWPGDTVAVSGLQTRVKSARLLATNRLVNFEQDRFRVRFTGLPAEAPDQPITTIAVECDSVPVQDVEFVRREKPRQGG